MRLQLPVPAVAALPLLLIPLVIVTVVLQLQEPRESAEDSSVQPPPEADYYLRNAELSTMDDRGQLLYRVRAANVLHYPDDTIRLDQVHVDYLDGPWQLTAASGLMTPGAVRLDLSGEVSMRGHLQSGDEMQLSTERLSVYFEERRLDTDAAVAMSSGKFRARAVGMRTDLDGREMALISQVQVDYEP